MDNNWLILLGGQPSGQDSGGSGFFMLIWFGLMFALMYFMLIRPQRKKQKEHQRLIAELKKGDKVITNGGMFGVIFAIDEERNRVVLKTGDDVRLEFLRSSIAGKVDK